MAEQTLIKIPTAIADLELCYSVLESDKVVDYLEKYPFLVPLLSQAPSEIRKYFLSAQLLLELVTDPDAYDTTDLVLFIIPSCEPDDASKSFDQFGEDWWLDTMSQAQGKLFIVTEYR